MYDAVQDYLKSTGTQFTEILLQVILRHKGPVTKCQLYAATLANPSTIDLIIRFLSENGVEELTLDFWSSSYCEVHSSLYTCPQLRHLSLSASSIELPPTFKGFMKLVRLHLTVQSIFVEDLERLISGCPVLEQLFLEVAEFLGYLDVDAPKLKLFKMYSLPTLVQFKNSPVLASISLIDSGYFPGYNLDTCDLVKFCQAVPALQHLELMSGYIKIFSVSMVQTCPPVILACLRILEVELSVDSVDDVSSVLCLMKLSPNLEKLRTWVSHDHPSSVIEFPDNFSDTSLDQLLEVEITYFGGTLIEMKFIKVLLGKSPKLESMVIKPNKYRVGDQGFEILKKLNKFGRASPNVEVCYEGSNLN